MTNEQKRIQADIDALMVAQNIRIEQDYQKRRNNKALNFLAGVFIISLALVGLVAMAKYENAKASQQKEIEIKTRTIK